MIKKLAQTVSYLFHPLLMPTLGILLLMNTGFYFALISFQAKKFIFLIIVTSTLLLPLLAIGLLMVNSKFKLDLDKNTDRLLPMLATAVFYYLGYYFMGKLPVFPVYRILIIASILTVVLLLIITSKWKISAHLAGIGGLIGAILALSLRLHINSSFLLSALIILAGVIGTSRIILGKHNPLQVYTGFLLGFLVNYLVIGFV